MSKQWAVRIADPTDDAAIRDLLKEVSQDGMIALGFEREPSYFNAISVSYSQPEVYVYEDLSCGRIVGVFSAGLRDVYINGQPQKVRYTGDLRVHPDYQGSRVMFRMIKQLKNILGEDGWAHTVILSDNKKSLDTVSKARGGMPQYFHHCRFHTHTIFPQRKLLKKPTAFNIRHAEHGDTPSIQVFFDLEAPKKQFYPCYDFSKIKANDNFYRGLSIEDFLLAFSGDKLVGILGLWNQEAFKQTRVANYKYPILRHIYNFLCPGLNLPKKGGHVNYSYVHTLVILDNQATVFRELLNAASQSNSNNFIPMIVGLDCNDPLNQALKPLRKHTLKSEHFLTSYADSPPDLLGTEFPYTYPEVARL